MKPTKPLSRDRDQSPRTEVNRRRLIQLLKRYRRILKRQLAFLDSRATETVPLLLVRTAAKRAKRRLPAMVGARATASPTRVASASTKA